MSQFLKQAWKVLVRDRVSKKTLAARRPGFEYIEHQDKQDNAFAPQSSAVPTVTHEQGEATVKIIKKGVAMRVVFFYPGEEGTYVDQAQVTLYESGLVHIQAASEETTTHVQNCEILWRFEVNAKGNGATSEAGLTRGQDRPFRVVKSE